MKTTRALVAAAAASMGFVLIFLLTGGREAPQAVASKQQATRGTAMLQAASRLRLATPPTEWAVGNARPAPTMGTVAAGAPKLPDLLLRPAVAAQAAALAMLHGNFTALQLLGPGTADDEPVTLVTHAWQAVVLHVLVVVAVALVYKSYFRTVSPEDGSPRVMGSFGDDRVEDRSFHFGLLDFDHCCGSDQKICLCAWCCTGIRWADTISQEKNKLQIGFWTLLFVHVACFSTGAWTAGLSGLIFLLPAVYYRQQLRKVFGLMYGTPVTCLLDIFVWAFCGPCAAAQEAREVEYLPTKLRD